MTTSNLTLSRAGYCERLEQLGLRELLRTGIDGQGLQPTAAEVLLGITAGDIADQALELATKGYVSFKRTFTCSTNDTVTLELIARGVTASAGSWRKIELVGSCGDDAGVATFTRTYGVLGATTPVLDVTFADYLRTASLPVEFDPERTAQAGTEAQTLAMAAGSGTLTVTYTGQSGDVTTGFFEVRVYPKENLTLV